jgi:ABC-type phosphonate transport system ATPase subunit
MTQHVLSASGITVGGRPRAMLPPTDVELHTGEVRAVVGEPGHGHTALALVLARRLRPDAGTVTLDGSVLDRTRQRAVALVDVPGVSEPDEVVPIGTILGEELAMAGQPARRRAVRAWAPDVEIHSRTEDVPAARRTELLLRATLPDRWGVTPAEWRPVTDELARHGYGVLVTVGETSRHLLDLPHTDLGGAS